MVKTCVYAIALNEIKFVDQFMEASKDADYILVCDTGSTDGTPERLRELGAIVYDIRQKPWRFDIPRNTALNLIPHDVDICLSIDLDEFLQPGWKDALENAWNESNGTIKRIAYDYIWSWKADDTPDVRFYADKVHHRYGYQWRHPCHETLYWIGEGSEVKVTVPKMVLHHRPDKNKSRGQYLGLLKIAVTEDPTNDRMSHYYARELMFYQQHEAAIAEFLRHLSLPTAQWKEERAASLRYISRCLDSLGRLKEAQEYALKSAIEWSKSRETWMCLAKAAYKNSDWSTCFWAATNCLQITNKAMTYTTDSSNWGADPHDHLAISAYYLGYYDLAKQHGKIAADLDPANERLTKNLEFYNSK